jgi:hypothetical protein
MKIGELIGSGDKLAGKEAIVTQKSKLERRVSNEIRRMRFVNQILIDRIEWLENKLDEQEQNLAVLLQQMTEHLIYLHRKIEGIEQDDGGNGIDPIMHEGTESNG